MVYNFYSFLLFLIASFTSYSFLREELTLPYESTDVVIGTVRKPNDFLTKLEIKNDGPLEKDEILKHFQGNSEKVWTKESIKLSRFKITFLFTLSYIFTSCFIISFSNLIILYKKKYDDEKFK